MVGYKSQRLGNVTALARLARTLDLPDESNPSLNAAGTGITNIVMRKRRLVAGFCRLIGEHLSDGNPAPLAPLADRPLSPRERQTLELLLAGDAEKQIAAKLALSQHTVHVYVKSLYKRFDVSSRGELLARWVRK